MSNLNPPTDIAVNQRPHAGSPLEVLRIFLRLGLTCFGGPIAHIGYFRDEFVVRRNWIDERSYADLVGLCQFLPGPASSQVGFSIGLMRAGYLGAPCPGPASLCRRPRSSFSSLTALVRWAARSVSACCTD